MKQMTTNTPIVEKRDCVAMLSACAAIGTPAAAAVGQKIIAQADPQVFLGRSIFYY